MTFCSTLHRVLQWFSRIPGISESIQKTKSLAKRCLFFLGMAFALPLVLIIILIRPLFLLRFGAMRSERIGHFVADIEAYLCVRDLAPQSVRAFDIFGCPQPVCNTQIKSMWTRTFSIFPAWRFWNYLDIACRYWTRSDHHHVKLSGRHQDYKLIPNSKAHLQFDLDEIERGRKLLQLLGIPPHTPWVCIHNRDAAYLNKTLAGNWAYHGYRDFDIQSLVDAAEELARRGYFVLRIGSVVAEKLVSLNAGVIDYASSHLRSDFGDIFLGGGCSFYMGSDSGIACVPFVFRKPVCFINFSATQLPALLAQDMSYPFIIKRIWHKEKRRLLSLREVFDSGLAGAADSNDFEAAGAAPVCNTSAEILEFAVEIDERLRGRWSPNSDDEELQRRFWEIFCQYSKNFYAENIKARVGTAFLRKNMDLLN